MGIVLVGNAKNNANKKLVRKYRPNVKSHRSFNIGSMEMIIGKMGDLGI